MQAAGLVERSHKEPSLFRITEKGVNYRNQFNSFVSLMDDDDVQRIHDYKKDPKTLLENLKLKMTS